MNTDTSGSLKKYLRFAVLEGVFGTPISMLSTGALLTGYALYLGATAMQISVIIALPFLTQIVQLFTPRLIDKVGSRQRVSAYGMLFHRIFWLPGAFLPLMLIAGLDPIPMLIVLLVCSLALFNIGQNSWLVWMADLIPSNERGIFFGRRNMYIGVTSVGFLLIAGIILDQMKSARLEGMGYSLLIIIAVGVGYFSYRYTLRLDDLTPSDGERIQLRALLRYVKRSPRFKSVLGFVAFWTLSTGIAAPFYFVHLYENLHWNYSNVTLYAAISGGLQLLLQPLWGWLLDRTGHKPVLQISISGITVMPLIWVLMAEPWSYWLWFEAVLSGFLWAGINITMFNIALYALPGEKKAPAMAAFSTIIGLVNVIVMILGGVIVSSVGQIRFGFGVWQFSPYHVVFLLSFFGRIFSARLSLAVQEPEAQRLGIVAYQMMSGLIKRVNLGRGFWVFRRNGRIEG